MTWKAGSGSELTFLIHNIAIACTKGYGDYQLLIRTHQKPSSESGFNRSGSGAMPQTQDWHYFFEFNCIRGFCLGILRFSTHNIVSIKHFGAFIFPLYLSFLCSIRVGSAWPLYRVPWRRGRLSWWKKRMFYLKRRRRRNMKKNCLVNRSPKSRSLR